MRQFETKMYQSAFGGRTPPGLAGEFKRSSDPLAACSQSGGKEKGTGGREGKGKKKGEGSEREVKSTAREKRRKGNRGRAEAKEGEGEGECRGQLLPPTKEDRRPWVVM